MGVAFLSPSSPRRRAALVAAAVVTAATTAMAAPIPSVTFTDGNVLNVSAVIGTGANAAYLAVDFNNGTSEAFQYNFNGSLNGYQLLTDVEAATTLKDVDTYYPAYLEHFITTISDGASTTSNYPALYYAPPAGGDTPLPASSQGIVFAQASTGADNLAVTNGQIVGFDNSYSAVPILPETSTVPEPTLLASGSVVLSCAFLRRRRRLARA
jgi:ABC-type molybdate transport system substrate-binding protein